MFVCTLKRHCTLKSHCTLSRHLTFLLPVLLLAAQKVFDFISKSHVTFPSSRCRKAVHHGLHAPSSLLIFIFSKNFLFTFYIFLTFLVGFPLLLSRRCVKHTPIQNSIQRKKTKKKNRPFPLVACAYFLCCACLCKQISALTFPQFNAQQFL